MSDSQPSSTSQPKVLVIHALRPTSRQTTIDHLLSFREHLPNADVQYLHFQQPLPNGITSDLEVDLLVVNYDFLNYRFTPLWPYIKRRHIDIARQAKKVVAIAQDDFWANELLDNWCMDWDVDRILTPITNNLDVLYPRSIKIKEFSTVLTGYVKSGPTPVTKPLRERRIDLGQRVRDMPPHLGRLAQAKARQAVAMADAAASAGFMTDVSTRVEDSFIGTEWFNFLASCKFTVGMKGGASLHDPRGFIHTRVQAYVARHPSASFDEIERKCFKGKDMQYEFTAISPRLFESALAGTCQILQREDYLGVLEPWRDYIPLDPDFGNMREVISAMNDLDQCQQIVLNSKSALVESGMFDYSKLVLSACHDFLLQETSESVHWVSLVNFLEFSGLAQKVAPDLHDAAVHLFSAASKMSKSSIVASQNILHIVNSAGLQEWFKKMSELSQAEKLSIRAPWVWRNIAH